MSTKAKRDGTQAEVALAYWLNNWFPDSLDGDPTVFRISSEGSKDRGDIGGLRRTVIECKRTGNRAPQYSSLLHNAQWKARNGNAWYWFLIHKPYGVGTSLEAVDNWDALMTVKDMEHSFGLEPLGHKTPFTQVYKEADWDNWETNETATLDYRITRTIGETASIHSWIIRATFVSRIQLIDIERVHVVNLLDEQASLAEELVVPIVISERKGSPPEDWYAYTLAWGAAKLLETVGVLPQDTKEYDVPEPMKRSDQ